MVLLFPSVWDFNKSDPLIVKMPAAILVPVSFDEKGNTALQ